MAAANVMVMAAATVVAAAMLMAMWETSIQPP